MSWNDIPGWTHEGVRRTYDRMVDGARNGDSIIEIGVAFGRSLAYVARRILDSGKDIKLYGIDPWDAGNWRANKPEDPNQWGGEYAHFVHNFGGPYNAFCEFMTRYAKEELEICRIIRSQSKDAARLFHVPAAAGVFIDGDHSLEGCKSDIYKYGCVVQPGGIIAGDDYLPEFPGVRAAVDDLFAHTTVTFDGPCWSIVL